MRTLNEYEDLEQIEDTIVDDLRGARGAHRGIWASALAHKERQIVTRTDGGESVQIEIYKEADANIVALAKRVKARCRASWTSRRTKSARTAVRRKRGR